MKWSLKHAYDNVPFYRKSFDDAGVHPDDLTSLSDLAKFPFTVKQDLRDNYPFGLFVVPREQISRIHASSGTADQRGLSDHPLSHARPDPAVARHRAVNAADGEDHRALG